MPAAMVYASDAGAVHYSAAALFHQIPHFNEDGIRLLTELDLFLGYAGRMCSCRKV